MAVLLAFYMPRNKIFTTQDTPFSTWHRSQHDGINMCDLDVIGMCPACAKPLFLADTIYNVDLDLEVNLNGIDFLLNF